MNIGGYEVLSGSQAKPYKKSDQIIFHALRQKQAVHADDFSEGELIPDGSIRRLTMPWNGQPRGVCGGSASAISEM
jgi:hypothetical protein